MAATGQLHTPDELAAKLRIPRDKVLRLVRQHKWPHQRISHHYIRFTAADIDEILRRTRVEHNTADASTAGLTGRSAARQRTRRTP